MLATIELVYALHLIQEMYHDIGLRFNSIESVREKIYAVQKLWEKSLAPAIIKYAIENGRSRPESEDLNGVSNDVLTM